jgi:hypothetical protein
MLKSISPTMQDAAKTTTSNRWHFDALSDDGREALMIDFTDNYHLSPRYHAQLNGAGSVEKPVPAVAFRYFVNGKLTLSSINELTPDAANTDGTFGDSSFRIQSTTYGSGFMVLVDLIAARGRHINAELEWLSVEDAGGNGSQVWHMMSPRSDVSGRISLVGRRGKTRKLFHFRGTGYADKIETTPHRRAWGRAHFVDATAIFEVQETGETSPKLILVRDGVLHEYDATVELRNSRDRYGLIIPARLQFTTEDNIKLRVKPLKIIQSGFFEARILSEITLMLRDGKPRKTHGITEVSNPARAKNRVFRWISDLRVGKNGKAPLL